MLTGIRFELQIELEGKVALWEGEFSSLEAARREARRVLASYGALGRCARVYRSGLALGWRSWGAGWAECPGVLVAQVGIVDLDLERVADGDAPP